MIVYVDQAGNHKGPFEVDRVGLFHADVGKLAVHNGKTGLFEAKILGENVSVTIIHRSLRVIGSGKGRGGHGLTDAAGLFIREHDVHL